MPAFADVLAGTLEQLRAADGGTGVVAAAVVDGDDVAYANSLDAGRETYVHAERNALATFVAAFGPPSEDAWVVTTLSPCAADDDRRVGRSCTDLLRGANPHDARIGSCYAGYLDPWQLDRAEYRERGLRVVETSDPDLRAACEELFGYFEEPGAVDSIPAFVREATADVDLGAYDPPAGIGAVGSEPDRSSEGTGRDGVGPDAGR